MNEDRFTISALKFLSPFSKCRGTRSGTYFQVPGAAQVVSRFQLISLLGIHRNTHGVEFSSFWILSSPRSKSWAPEMYPIPGEQRFFEMHKKCHYEGLLIPGHRYLDFPRDRPLTFIVNFEHSSKMDLSHTWPQRDSNSGETIFFILLLFRRRSTRGWRHRNWCTIQTLGTTADTWPAEFFQPAKRAKVWRTPGRSKCSVSRNQNHFSKDNYWDFE